MRVALSILAFLAIVTLADYLVTGGFYTERSVEFAARTISALF